jgi:ADP-ribose pyrophosphatase YjhB (NUDIX family)
MIKGERSFIGIFRASNNPGIALPCGKIEDGESAREAALREFLEETGVKCRITKDAPFVDFVGNTEVTMFFGDIHLGEERVPLKSSREGISGWYTKEEMLKGPYGDYNLKAFRHFGVL